MSQQKLNNLIQTLKDISANFEELPYTENIKLLNEKFSIDSIDSPNQYLLVIEELSEFLRQTRLLFIYSVLNMVCKEEDKIYLFNTPFEASMKYYGIKKSENTFYLQDEDGDFRDVFISEKFVQFIDDNFWELYENQ